MSDYSHPYLANCATDIEEMLKELGISSIEELFSDIPEDIRFKGELKLPHYPSELEVKEHVEDLLSKNKTTREIRSFLGGGVLDIYIPAAQDELLRRTEFYSAYTPYQPETSQGTLHTLFEYQSMLCELLSLDTTNCSMYDWATALGEAANMTVRLAKKRFTFLFTGAIAPNRLEVLKNYVSGLNVTLVEVPYDTTTGKMDVTKAIELMTEDVAGIYFENPNYFGVIEDNIKPIIEAAKERNIMVVAGVELSSLGLIEGPGDYGVDIAIGDAQSVGGGPMNFGGPMTGVFSMKFDRKWTRQMPGRLVGITLTPKVGKWAFTNTLQTREQHIKRHRATSNICTNEALTAMSVAFHLALLGPQGITETGESMYYNAHYLKAELEKIGVKPVFNGEFFNAFTIDLKIPKDKKKEFTTFMLGRKIFAGIPYSFDGENYDYLVTTSYLLRKKDLDDFVKAIEEWRK